MIQDDECISEFRFLKHDIEVLFDALIILEEIICYNKQNSTDLLNYVLFLNGFLMHVGN